MVTFSTSSLSLILGFPSISTSTRTQRGLAQTRDEFVPIPNAVMAWPCCFRECSTSSWMSLLATTTPRTPASRVPSAACACSNTFRVLRLR